MLKVICLKSFIGDVKVRATRLHPVYISIEFDTNSGYLYRESKSERTTSHADHADGGAEKLTFTRNFWFNSEQNRSTW